MIEEAQYGCLIERPPFLCGFKIFPILSIGYVDNPNLERLFIIESINFPVKFINNIIYHNLNIFPLMQ